MYKKEFKISKIGIFEAIWCKNLVTKQEKMVKLSNIKTEIENA